MSVVSSPSEASQDIYPYRSLDTFTEEDSQFFFGRERLTAKLIENLKREPRFLALLGASGSGKSSVIRAGLIPVLRKGKVSDSDKWGIITIRPGRQPFEQLVNAGLSKPEDDLIVSVQKWLENLPATSRLVLFIDQFEELFTICTSDTRRNFIAEVAQLLESTVPVSVILTMRDDFYSEFIAESQHLTEWLERGLVIIPPTLTQTELREIIVAPAEAVGVKLESNLVDAICFDASVNVGNGESIRNTLLPLIQLTLSQLWEHQKDKAITYETYRSIGGITGSLPLWADNVFYLLSSPEQNRAKHILLSLIGVGRGTSDYAISRTLEELYFDQADLEVLNKLIKARLIASYTELETGKTTVRLVHESLLSHWKRLDSWIAEERSFLLWNNKIHERYIDWEHDNRSNDSLLSGSLFLESLEWLKFQKEILTVQEVDFIYRSTSFWSSWRGKLISFLLRGFRSPVINSEATFQFERMRKMSKKVKVFLCHSSSDKPLVRKIYNKLVEEGFDTWLDEEKLVGGQEWQSEIPKAVRNSDVVLVCLSKNSVNKIGYIQKEIRFALEVALEQPEGAIYIIPVRLEECDVPERLKLFQWVNYYESNGFEKMLKSLELREEQVSKE